MNIGPKILTDNLIMSLDASITKSYPGSGSTLYDLTANNNGTINGASFNSANRGNLSFASASSNYVNTGLQYDGADKELTMGVWMKAPAVAQRCGLFGFRSAYSGSSVMSQNQLYITGDVNAGSSGTGCSFDDWRKETDGTFPSWRSVYALSTPVCDGNWHNIMVVRATASTKLFIDGVLQDENSDGTITNVTSDNYFKLGVAGNSAGNLGGYYFNGNIATCHVYNVALSDKQIKDNFNALKGRFDA